MIYHIRTNALAASRQTNRNTHYFNFTLFHKTNNNNAFYLAFVKTGKDFYRIVIKKLVYFLVELFFSWQKHTVFVYLVCFANIIFMC